MAETVRFVYEGRRFDVPRDFVENVHPGGADVMLVHEDGDMTNAFKSVGHSDDAIAMMEAWAIDPRPQAAGSSSGKSTAATPPPSKAVSFGIPVAIGIAAAVAILAILVVRRK